MQYSNDELNSIYDRTDGRCHICYKQLAFINYGRTGGARGAWEVEHSRPRAKGGTGRINNLYAACIACNRQKGITSTRSARLKHGKTRAPRSIVKQKEVKLGNAALGAGIGLVGFLINPAVGLLSVGLGSVIGYRQDAR